MKISHLCKFLCFFNLRTKLISTLWLFFLLLKSITLASLHIYNKFIKKYHPEYENLKFNVEFTTAKKNTNLSVWHNTILSSRNASRTLAEGSQRKHIHIHTATKCLNIFMMTQTVIQRKRIFC